MNLEEILKRLEADRLEQNQLRIADKQEYEKDTVILKAEIEEKLVQIASLNEQLLQKTSFIEDQQNKLEDLKTQLEDLKNQLLDKQSVIGNLKEENTKLKRYNQEYLSIMTQKDKKIDLLVQEKIKDVPEGLLKLSEQSDQNLNDPYDFTIAINDLRQINEGIYIQFKDYFDQSKKDGTITSFVGNFNTGKTFLMSKILKTKLPQGFQQKTIGVRGHIDYSETIANSISYYLDSMGSGETLQLYQLLNVKKQELAKIKNQIQNIQQIAGQAVDTDDALKQQKGLNGQQNGENRQLIGENRLYQSDDIMGELQNKQAILKEEIVKLQGELEEKELDEFKSKNLLEKFVQSFLFHSSDIIVLTVDIMNILDQKLIKRVINYQKNKIYKKQKKIIIVHNFAKLRTEEQVNFQIQKDIIGNFDVRLFSKNVFVHENPEIDCTHLVLAQEGSQAGDEINDKTYAYIRLLIKEHRNLTQNIDIKQILIKFLNDKLDTYILYNSDKEEKPKNNPSQLEFEFKEINDPKEQEEIEKSTGAKGKLKFIVCSPQLRNCQIVLKDLWYDDYGSENQQLRYRVLETNKYVIALVEIPGLGYVKQEDGSQCPAIEIEPDFCARRFSDGNYILRLKLRYSIPQYSDLEVLNECLDFNLKQEDLLPNSQSSLNIPEINQIIRGKEQSHVLDIYENSIALNSQVPYEIIYEAGICYIVFKKLIQNPPPPKWHGQKQQQKQGQFQKSN